MIRDEIAVIIPVYNAAGTLRRCVDSVLNQQGDGPDGTDHRLRVMLVDDGSKDESGQLCDEYAARDERIRVIHKANEGLMATWMRGLAECSSPYVCFLDSDDYLEPVMLSKLREAGEEGNHRQILCCGYRIEREWNGTFEEKGHRAPAGVYTGDKLQRGIKDQILGHEQRTVILSRCMKVISRELMERNLHYCDPSIRMGEDTNIMVPAILDAERIVLLDRAYYYHYTFVSDSMVHAYDPGMYDNIRKLKEKLGTILADKQVPDAEQMLQREYLFLFLVEMKNELRKLPEKNTDSKHPAEREIRSRIREICLKEHSPELAAAGRGEFRETASRLILWMMKKPDALRIALIRKIFLLQASGVRKA